MVGYVEDRYIPVAFSTIHKLSPYTLVITLGNHLG